VLNVKRGTNWNPVAPRAMLRSEAMTNALADVEPTSVSSRPDNPNSLTPFVQRPA
jgi:hypothetical protein